MTEDKLYRDSLLSGFRQIGAKTPDAIPGSIGLQDSKEPGRLKKPTPESPGDLIGGADSTFEIVGGKERNEGVEKPTQPENPPVPSVSSKTGVSSCRSRKMEVIHVSDRVESFSLPYCVVSESLGTWTDVAKLCWNKVAQACVKYRIKHKGVVVKAMPGSSGGKGVVIVTRHQEGEGEGGSGRVSWKAAKLDGTAAGDLPSNVREYKVEPFLKECRNNEYRVMVAVKSEGATRITVEVLYMTVTKTTEDGRYERVRISDGTDGIEAASLIHEAIRNCLMEFRLNSVNGLMMPSI